MRASRVVDELLEVGVPIDGEIYGATVLHHAAFHGKPAAVRHLVERGADPVSHDPVHDAAALGWARFRHRELFRPSPGHDAVEAYLSSVTERSSGPEGPDH